MEDVATAARKKGLVRNWIEACHGTFRERWASYEKFFHEDAGLVLTGSTPGPAHSAA